MSERRRQGERRGERNRRFTRTTSVVSQETTGSDGRVHFVPLERRARRPEYSRACHRLLRRCVVSWGNHRRQVIFFSLFFFFSFLQSFVLPPLLCVAVAPRHPAATLVELAEADKPKCPREILRLAKPSLLHRAPAHPFQLRVSDSALEDVELVLNSCKDAWPSVAWEARMHPPPASDFLP
ncbi:hypothetical protein LZ30DRAFT_352027 [Colletotrichum cereale]|nr:hypothetical protein LZ30DRAFT_352027 [Colletotrichum cereale]